MALWHSLACTLSLTRTESGLLQAIFFLTGLSGIVLACLIDQAIYLFLTAPAHFISSSALKQSLS